MGLSSWTTGSSSSFCLSVWPCHQDWHRTVCVCWVGEAWTLLQSHDPPALSAPAAETPWTPASSARLLKKQHNTHTNTSSTKTGECVCVWMGGSKYTDVCVYLCVCLPVSVWCGRYTDRLLRIIMAVCVCCRRELMWPGFIDTHEETLAPREKHTQLTENSQIITHPANTTFIIIFIMCPESHTQRYRPAPSSPNSASTQIQCSITSAKHEKCYKRDVSAKPFSCIFLSLWAQSNWLPGKSICLFAVLEFF